MEQMWQKQWEELLAEYETSGQPINVWCKSKKISITTFMNWRRMRKMTPVESHFKTSPLRSSGVIKIHKAGWEINARCPVDMDELEKVVQLVAEYSN